MSHAAEPSLRVHVDRSGPAVVVRLAGSAGMNDADALREELASLAADHGGAIVVDLSELEFISSQGLGALISVQKARRAAGAPVKLVNPRPAVRQVLETTRLTKIFPIYPSTDCALAAE